MAPPLQTASSVDGHLVALVVPSSGNSSRILIQIYQNQASSTSCTLQQTLTYHSQSKGAASATLRKLLFVGDKMLVGQFGTSQIVTWDLERGVMTDTVTAPQGNEFLEVAADDTNELFFALVLRDESKLYIHEYQSRGAKLQRKIKSGHWEASRDDPAATSLAVSATHAYVRSIGGGGVRVLERETGKRVAKIKINSTAKAGSRIHTMAVFAAIDMMVLVKDTGAIGVYSTDKFNEIVEITREGGDKNATTLQMNSDGVLLIDQEIYRVDANALTSYRICQIAMPAATPAALFLAESKFVTLLYKSAGASQPAFYELESGEIPPQITVGETASTATAAASAKRKADSGPAILGPGQAGAETSIVDGPKSKKKKTGQDEGMEVDGDDQEMDDTDPRNQTIAERLKAMSRVLDESSDEDEDDEEEEEPSRPRSVSSKSKFNAQKVTTASLKQLLSQALQSNDDSLLDMALQVRDSRIIQQSLDEIDEELVATLFGKLTSKLAAHPMRAETLVIWLSNCLRNGHFNPRHLSVLQNLINDRVEMLPDLLRLEGRLSMMCSLK